MNELPDFTSSPEVNIDQSQLVFQAQECGQILTKTLTVTNNIPDSTLKGKWTVYPHQNDPPHTPDDHAFISFSPKYFEGNNIQCQVTVDTSKLQSNKTGERTIILKSNLGLKEYPVKVQIETAPPPEKKKITYWFFIFLGVVFFCSWIFGIVVFSIVYLVPLSINDSMSFYKTYFLMTLFFPPLITLILGIFSGIIVGVFSARISGQERFLGAIIGSTSVAISVSLAIYVASILTLTFLTLTVFLLLVFPLPYALLFLIFQLYFGIILVVYLVIYLGISRIILAMVKKGFNRMIIDLTILLTIVSGASLGGLSLYLNSIRTTNKINVDAIPVLLLVFALVCSIFLLISILIRFQRTQKKIIF